ncbi:MAG: nSTAND1 domain-containing NTPase [Methylobacter sp.]
MFGASGAGKSSLLRAGLLYELHVKNSAAGIDHWRYALLRPADAQHGGLLQLIAGQLLSRTALPELAEVGFGDAEALAEQLREHPAGLAGALKQALRLAGDKLRRQRGWGFRPELRLVLLVDQMEEIFRFEAGQRDGLLAVLAAFAESGSIWIAATMRDEFYPQAAAHPVLGGENRRRPVRFTRPQPGRTGRDNPVSLRGRRAWILKAATATGWMPCCWTAPPPIAMPCRCWNLPWMRFTSAPLHAAKPC